MHLTLSNFLISAINVVLSSLIATGLFSLFVWINNWYEARHGGTLMKYNFRRIFVTLIGVSCVLSVIHSFGK